MSTSFTNVYLLGSDPTNQLSHVLHVVLPWPMRMLIALYLRFDRLGEAEQQCTEEFSLSSRRQVSAIWRNVMHAAVAALLIFATLAAIVATVGVTLKEVRLRFCSGT